MSNGVDNPCKVVTARLGGVKTPVEGEFRGDTRQPVTASAADGGERAGEYHLVVRQDRDIVHLSPRDVGYVCVEDGAAGTKDNVIASRGRTRGGDQTTHRTRWLGGGTQAIVIGKRAVTDEVLNIT